MANPSLSPPLRETFIHEPVVDGPLRPTRAAFAEPSRRGPSMRPRLVTRMEGAGVADEVVSALSRISHAGPISLKDTPAQSARRRSAVIVARFPRGALLEPMISSLESRALEVRRLETVSTELPRDLGEAFRRIVRTAAVSSATLGFLGALACSMLLSGEALVPSVGWIPGPLIGAAMGAGAFGALGFVIGVLAMLAFPSVALHHVPRGTVFVVVRAREFDVEAIVGRIVDAGGTVSAVGEG